MTERLKHQLRGILYIMSGAFLTVSGIFSWSGLDFIWGNNYSIDGQAGGMHITVIIIGLALIAASYFEFVNARISRQNEQDHDNKD